VLQLHWTGNLYHPRWSPDGKWLLFQTDIASPGSGDILAIRPAIDTAPVPVVGDQIQRNVSRLFTQRAMAGVRSRTRPARTGLRVPFPNTSAGKWAISTGPGTEPLWSHRGGELFYRDASGNLVVVAVNYDAEISLGRSTALFSAAGILVPAIYPPSMLSPQTTSAS